MNSVKTINDNKRNQIIWAVDPTQNPSDASALIKEMKKWAKLLNCSIQPVTIFTNRIINLPMEWTLPQQEQFRKMTQKLLDRYFKKVKAENILPPEKIFISSNSTRKMALELAKYAERKKALILFAHTRARKTWNPFRLGGFAETLVAVSRTPVLLFNPETKASPKIPSILFPTDFNRDSKVALMNLSPWAKAFHSKVLLYNRMELPAAIYMSELSGYWLTQSTSLDLMMDDLENVRNKKGHEWVNILKKQGIESTSLIQHQKKSLAADILEAAKKNKVGLIALVNRSGPVAQTILGGVARDILLQAECPVLIFYCPKAKRKTLTEKNPPEINKITKAYIRKTETAGVQHG